MGNDEQWAPDHQQPRPIPDRSLRVRAQRDMIQGESEIHRYVRQQWETTLAGVKVALDAWRKIWPFEHSEFPPADAVDLGDIEHTLAGLWRRLDHFSEEMVGQAVDGVEHFAITTRQELDRFLPEEERHGQPDEA